MGKQMEDYIQETSSVMVRNIEQRKELTKPLIGWLLKEGIRQGKTLVIVASGSSYHAAQSALAVPLALRGGFDEDLRKIFQISSLISSYYILPFIFLLKYVYTHHSIDCNRA